MSQGYTERDLIQFASRNFHSKNASILYGIGDDAAVLKLGNKKLLITTDSLQEHIHFEWKYTSAFLLGRKSLAVNLSDIAAMGGRPLWAVLALAIPRHERKDRVQKFMKGLQFSARQQGVFIVGGDTDHSQKDWKITITLLGEAKHPIYRNGAKVGDDIWVTGFLGCSALGLEILRKGEAYFARTKNVKKFINAHLNPPPRVSAGRVLSKNKLAHSMIDVSDGCLLDLERLCEASHVGAEIEWENVPLNSGFLELCQDLKKNPQVLALSGGEDYELLFAASPKKRNEIIKKFRAIKTKVSRVGHITSKSKGISVLDSHGQKMIFSYQGYQHF